eukprot:TRINITY_DN2558_c0_g1_i9.p1 TRINITY_DN2558_c0_g1~~TRINITY_DN2558_c0_g1_i9.p1  ORF type:complete len:504 (+),score=0.67 TRINITY_DN2558_c0_g1_i9:291-1802(+)
MLNHFFDSLVGPKCKNLKVREPEKYGFAPKDLLQKIAGITLCFAYAPSASSSLTASTSSLRSSAAVMSVQSALPIAAGGSISGSQIPADVLGSSSPLGRSPQQVQLSAPHESCGLNPIFAATMAMPELDYSPAIMDKAVAILATHRLLPDEQLQRLRTFASCVNQHFQPLQSGSVARPSVLTDSVVELSPSVLQTHPISVSSGSESMDVVENEERPKEDEQPEPPEAKFDEAELERRYVEALRDLQFDSFPMASEETGAYEHHYASNIAAPGAVTGSKMARLQKEMQTLSTSLPLAVGSSVFLRVDDERMDVGRAVITGPAGTPYSSGCFTFDLYFPASYPSDPPLVNLETTGNGTMRFNPNLYGDGKVCLSLLGTWHGDANSKWNSSTSSLFQVLVSIQGLILIDHPYFNEPAYEAQRGTKEGVLRSAEYNETIRLGTIRYAMTGQLRSPSPGFEDVIKTHFRLQKARVTNLCQEWLAESSESFRPRMERAIADLLKELEKL